MSLKVPFYIACSNFLLLTDVFPQVYRLTIYRELWPGLACEVFGAFIFLFMLLNILLVVAVSINTYIRICLKKNPSLGRYDWKLLLTVLIISLAIAATEELAEYFDQLALQIQQLNEGCEVIGNVLRNWQNVFNFVQPENITAQNYSKITLKKSDSFNNDIFNV
ncbi:2283_t:CDS:2 [Entrophospora sp. SA101]|nr:2283_t:CDS:2 [Entrophospora sp. SA101]CAJ0914426.1 16568_t:CDS:2 [Entrophospora sp. SA101]